ncbi:MAG: response regulator [Fibrobacter sp.]|nr:response regulator [Fibrobacter sp.]
MKTILVVDDTKELRKLVRMTLEYEDCRIIEASSGKEAVESASRKKPDIIIMDLFMPGEIDGLEATRRIKSNPKLSECNVIILTGSRSCHKEEAIKAGANDFLQKPFSPLTLIDKVEHILKK